MSSAATIGMEVTAALRFAAQVAAFFPGAGTAVGAVLQLAPEAVGLVSAIMNMASQNRGPTAEEQAELERLLASNHAAIQARAAQAAQT